jgi:hypothetical protein
MPKWGEPVADHFGDPGTGGLLVELSTSTDSSVLVLDFTGIGKAQSFSTLLTTLGPRRTSRFDPISSHFDRRRSIEDQAGEICAAQPAPPGHVFGYCTGALLAATVAARFRHQHGREPHVTLFDPDAVTWDYLADEFEVLFASLGGTEAPQRGADLPRYERELEGRRLDLVAASGGAAQAGELVDYLLGRHRAWLRFLDASADGRAVDLDGSVSVISGRESADLTGILTRPGHHRLYRSAAPEGGLLAHPDTPLLVEAVLRR